MILYAISFIVEHVILSAIKNSHRIQYLCFFALVLFTPFLLSIYRMTSRSLWLTCYISHLTFCEKALGWKRFETFYEVNLQLSCKHFNGFCFIWYVGRFFFWRLCSVDCKTTARTFFITLDWINLILNSLRLTFSVMEPFSPLASNFIFHFQLGKGCRKEHKACTLHNRTCLRGCLMRVFPQSFPTFEIS